MTSRRFLLGAFVSAAALCVFATPGMTEEASTHNAGAVSTTDQADTTLSGDNASTTPEHHEGAVPPPMPEHHDNAAGAHDAVAPAGGEHHEADATRGGAEHHDATHHEAGAHADVAHTDATHHEAGAHLDVAHTDAAHHEAGAHVDVAHTDAAHHGHHQLHHNPAFKNVIDQAQVSQETKDLVNEFMKQGTCKELQALFDSEEFEAHEVAERRQVIEEISATARAHNMYGFVKKATSDAMTRLLQEYQMEVTEDNAEARGDAAPAGETPVEAAPQAEETPEVTPAEEAPTAVGTVAAEGTAAPAAAQ